MSLRPSEYWQERAEKAEAALEQARAERDEYQAQVGSVASTLRDVGVQLRLARGERDQLAERNRTLNAALVRMAKEIGGGPSD